MFLEVDIQFAFAMEFTTSVLDTCSGKYTVQRRNQDECQHSRYRQTTDYGNRHRTPHLRTLSATDSHRDHTQNGSSCCHQYRTETALTRCHHRVDDRHTPLSTERDVVDEHNTVLLSALENTPPELYADIVHNGIYLAGGGALLRGLDKRLTDKINIPFHIAEDPLHAVAKGTGVALKNVDRFSFLMR